MAKRYHITADDIFNRTMRSVAALPCQEEYLRQLSAILSFHLHRNEILDLGFSADNLPALSAIVVAPTGQGKTFLLRKMAEAAHINLITVDASSLAAEGWKGVSLGTQLLNMKNTIRDDRVFERSILMIDEVDKIRMWGTRQDQGNPTSNLLQLFNSGFYTAEDANKNAVEINTRRFTVLLGGAFSGIEDIIQNRICPKGKVGFLESESRCKRSAAELMQMVTLDDLKEYGMLQEFLGRVGTILTIPSLSLADYRQLLSADTGSIKAKYDTYFRKLYGVRFQISEAGTEEIARKCMKLSTGARAVNPLVNDLLRSAIAEVERNTEVCEVILDAGDNGHFIRYISGTRGWGLYNLQPRPKKEFYRGNHRLSGCKIRAKCFPALVNKLCRYYRNAGGAEYRIPELEAFLNCSLLYLFEYCRKEDQTFESLIKLAKQVDRKGNDRSVFENMVCPKMKDHEFCKDFMCIYHKDLQRHLEDALEVIRRYMVEMNGDATFYLELKHRSFRL